MIEVPSAASGPLSAMLRIGATRTHIFRGEASESAPLSFALGYLSPALGLRHEPPNAAELEGAIEVIEDTVMPLARLVSSASRLVTDDDFAVRLLDLAGRPGANSGDLPLSDVEALFNDLAAVSQGRPSAGSPYLDPALCGYLLILREFMHHLAFRDITVVVPATANRG
jgi:hypothetical protein